MSAGWWIVVSVTFVGHAAAALLYAAMDLPDATRGAIYFGSKVVVNAIPLVWVFGVERRKPAWAAPIRPGCVVSGGLTGLVMGAGILCVYFFALAEHLGISGDLEPGATGGLTAGADALRAKVAAYGLVEHFFLFAPFLCIVNSGLEEYYWRWFLYGMLRRRMSTPPAALLSALGFTLHHVVVLSAYFPGIGMVALLNAGVFLGGVIWAVLYEKRARLYAPWISHMLVDVAIMIAVYDVLFVR